MRPYRLYDDPDTVRLVEGLAQRGLSHKQIASRMEISKSTVRKVLEAGFVEQERQRFQDVDKQRGPKRRQDPRYRAYQAAAGESDKHRERVRRAAVLRRHGPDAYVGPLPDTSPAVRARIERVTAEERRQAEAGRIRGTAELSLDASIAAIRLMRRRGCTWSTLIDALLIAAAAEERTKQRCATDEATGR